MAANRATALKQWAHVIERWPVDRLRPEHVSFQKVMQSRISKAHATPQIKANEALVSPAEPLDADPEKEMRQLKALENLLSNKFKNAYPLPKAVRYPKSQPEYYDNVIQELEEAPTRSWGAAFVNRFKGALRWS